MVLSPRIAIPRREDCTYELPRPAAFLGISMYTDAYAYKAEYLRASCVAIGVCCALSHVPNDAFGEDLTLTLALALALTLTLTLALALALVLTYP